MKLSKKIGITALCVLVLCVSMILGACGGEQASTPTSGSNSGNEAEYRVTVVDGAGTPYTTGVIVQFMQNGEKVALQTVDANGVAAKTLAKGDYTVELMFTGNADDYYYDNSGLTLSADQTELEVVLSKAMSAQTQTLFVNGKEIEAAFSGLEPFKITEDMNIIDLLVNGKVCSSKREAREFINNGSITFNGEKVSDVEFVITKDVCIENKYAVIRRGKKKYYIGVYE